jgi:predicted DNA-binding transcriptional regulator
MASGSNILSRKSGRWRRSWSWWTASIKKLSTAGRRLWQLHLVEMMLNQSPHTAQLRAVLQTYMVSLAEVKRDIDLWKEPLEAEMQALVQSGTIRRAKADQVPQESGYDYMTVAPAKIVPTIKSPVGKRISA